MCFRYLTVDGSKIFLSTINFLVEAILRSVDMHVFAILLLKFLAIKTMCWEHYLIQLIWSSSHHFCGSETHHQAIQFLNVLVGRVSCRAKKYSSFLVLWSNLSRRSGESVEWFHQGFQHYHHWDIFSHALIPLDLRHYYEANQIIYFCCMFHYLVYCRYVVIYWPDGAAASLSEDQGSNASTDSGI